MWYLQILLIKFVNSIKYVEKGAVNLGESQILNFCSNSSCNLNNARLNLLYKCNRIHSYINECSRSSILLYLTTNVCNGIRHCLSILITDFFYILFELIPFRVKNLNDRYSLAMFWHHLNSNCVILNIHVTL